MTFVYLRLLYPQHVLRAIANPSSRLDGANPNSPYYPALDGLRAIAVLSVFLGHYAHFRFGGIGVDIFFVLSGFLITGILYDARDTPHRFRNFYIRRILRIFPAYYALWFVLLALTPLLHIDWQFANLLWPAYLGNWLPFLAPDSSNQLLAYPQGHLVLLNTGHFWTLCMEEQFYLLWPIVVFTVRNRSTLLRICAVTIVLSPLLRIALGVFTSQTFFSGLSGATFCRFDEFLFGGLAALALRGQSAEKIRCAGPYLFWSGGAAVVVFAIASLRMLGRNPDGVIMQNWIMFAGITIACTLALGMLLMCLDKTTWLGGILNLTPLRALGRLSYGFYLWHDVPHAFFEHAIRIVHLSPRGLGLIIPFTGTLVLTLASYHLIERPFLKLKTRFEA
jgi:peptidoglycan/LPS O-acetylase OafA/YrhL